MCDGRQMNFRAPLPLVLAEDHQVGVTRPVANVLDDIAPGFDPGLAGDVPFDFLPKYGGRCYRISRQLCANFRNDLGDATWLPQRGEFDGRRDVESGKGGLEALSPVDGKAKPLPPRLHPIDMHQQVSEHSVLVSIGTQRSPTASEAARERAALRWIKRAVRNVLGPRPRRHSEAAKRCCSLR
jgi:hypothetical protein